MLFDDIIYVILLLVCIGFGPFYRNIEDIRTKQWVSTILGLTLVTFVSGTFVVHPLLTTLINAIVITRLSPRICHLVSFFFSFFYLLVIFRLGDNVGLSTPPGHTNLVVMILTLKLPGLAFEVNSAATAPEDDPEGANSAAFRNVGFMDIIHYAFSYMGILTGPYYRYRTYWDHLHRPFAKYVDPWPVTLSKLKLAAGMSVLFLIMNQTFPSKYVVTEEYAARSLFYKILYIYPAFTVFRLRIFSGMVLAECACHMAGLGTYPTSCDNAAGRGPKNYKAVEELSKNPEKLKEEKYDFDTVRNMDVFAMETVVSVREAMKIWNSCIQYWMATCVYKRFPYKGLRIVATLTLSALWHGYAAGYYFCICQVPLYLPLEDLSVKYYKPAEKDSFARKAWDLYMWVMRLSCMAYLGVPFLLLDLYEIIQFYKNLYFCGHILGAVFYILARVFKPYVVAKQRKQDKNK